MGISRIILLFDYKSFGKMTTPVLNELRNGSYAGLQKLADATAKEHPEVWELLSNLYFPSIVNEVWDNTNIDGAIDFWINLLICRYSLELDAKLERSDPSFSGVIKQLGVDEKLVNKFLMGKPIKDFLLSLTTSSENPKQEYFENLYFKLGWLSLEDVESIKNEIQVYQKQNNHPAYESWLNILNIAIIEKKGFILGILM